MFFAYTGYARIATLAEEVRDPRRGIPRAIGLTIGGAVLLYFAVAAIARRGDLPRSLAIVHAEYEVPGRAVLLVGVIAAAVAATGTLRGVASAAAFTILVYYGIANVAALRMPPGTKLYSDAVPFVGLLACALLAASLDWPVIGTGTVVLMMGFVVRSLVRRRAVPAD